MPKIGVGVGDEFPVDEGKAPESEKPEEARDEECQHWREKRREWHRHWREHGHRWGGGRYSHWRSPSARHVVPALIAIGGIALLIAIISHFFYFILGGAVLAVLYYMHRDYHGAMWDMHPRGRSAQDAQ